VLDDSKCARFQQLRTSTDELGTMVGAGALAELSVLELLFACPALQSIVDRMHTHAFSGFSARRAPQFEVHSIAPQPNSKSREKATKPRCQEIVKKYLKLQPSLILRVHRESACRSMFGFQSRQPFLLPSNLS